MLIYSLFSSKQPSSISDIVDQDGICVTFLNPYSFAIAKVNPRLYEEFDYICSDGSLPVFINNIFNKDKIKRYSFDMSSLAPLVFSRCVKFNKTCYILGSTEECISKFVFLLESKYNLQIVGWQNGYFSDSLKVINEIRISNPDIVIIGMGTPLQDELAVVLKRSGYKGSIFTCGGFIHQTTTTLNYYPQFIQRTGLRWLYRLFKEKHVLKRIVKYYPVFIYDFIIYNIRK